MWLNLLSQLIVGPVFVCEIFDECYKKSAQAQLRTNESYFLINGLALGEELQPGFRGIGISFVWVLIDFTEEFEGFGLKFTAVVSLEAVEGLLGEGNRQIEIL